MRRPWLISTDRPLIESAHGSLCAKKKTGLWPVFFLLSEIICSCSSLDRVQGQEQDRRVRNPG